MELTQLRYFLKVAQQGNFTRAGHELGITQPALSRSISKLEEELGQPLFERQTRSVCLTDAGRLFQGRAEQILALVDDTLSELSDNGETGRIRVGAIPTIAPFFLPSLLRSFCDQHPQAKVVAFEETTDRLLQRCRMGEVDVALIASPVSVPYLETEPLFDEELMLVLPTGHELTERARIAMSDLRDFPFVLLDETHCLSETVISICRQKSFQPFTVEHTSQLAMVEELVALGHGVSLIPQMARKLDTSDRRVYRSVSRPTPVRTVMQVWNPYRFQSKLAEKFKQCVRKAVKALGYSNSKSHRHQH